MDAWEEAKIKAHKQFDEEVRKKHRLHLIEGMIMAPMMFIAPFVFLYVLAMLIGR